MFKTLVVSAGLFASSILAIPQADAGAGPLLVFNPPSLNLSPIGGGKFTVALKTAPKEDTSITIKAAGYSFSTCTLKFTALNYATPQTLDVYPLPNIHVEEKSQTVQAKACICNSEYSGKDVCTDYPITQPVVNGGTCVVTGDPHYTTFTGQKYDYQPTVDTYLFNSDLLSVQVRTFPCTTPKNAEYAEALRKVTCIGSVAVRYGGSAVIVETPHDKKLLTPTRITPENAQECNVIAIDGDARKAVDIVLSDKSKISLTMGEWGEFTYINVALFVAGGRYADGGGYCNRLRTAGGVPIKGYYKADGSSTEDVAAFADSWKVPATDNLFEGKYVAPKKAFAQLPTNQCTEKPVCAVAVNVAPTVTLPPPTTTAEAVSPENTSKPPVVTTNAPPAVTVPPVTPPTGTSVPPKPTCAPIVNLPVYVPKSQPVYNNTKPVGKPGLGYDQATLDKCKAQCEKIIPDNSCKNYVNRSSYVEDCAQDYALTGALAFADSAKNAYLSMCRIQSETLEVCGVKEKADAAIIVKKECGLGPENKCYQDCNNKGKCTPNGCSCQKGYSGTGCAVKLYEMPVEDKSEVVSQDGKTVNVVKDTQELLATVGASSGEKVFASIALYVFVALVL